jgi:hypothetical protein
MMKFSVSILFVLFHLYSQAQIGSANELNLELGLAFRSTALNPRGLDPRIPFNFEKNLQGMGTNIGIEYKRVPSNISFMYFTTIRYDHLRYGNNGSQGADMMRWFIDHNIALRYYVKKCYLGIEMNKMNSGASFDYYDASHDQLTTGPIPDNEPLTHLLDFNTLSIGIGIPIKFLVLETKFSFSRFDNPYSIYFNQPLSFIGIKLYYSFQMTEF